MSDNEYQDPRTEAAHYCDDDEQPTALYPQSAIDCRTCGRYWTGKNKCGATVLCHAGSQYTPSGPVLLFLRMDDAPRLKTPNVEIEAFAAAGGAAERERWLKAATAALELLDDLPGWSNAGHACQLLRACVLHNG